MIRFKCIYCGQKVRTPDENVGKQGKCPKCNAAIVVPNPQNTSSAAKAEVLSEDKAIQTPDPNAPIGLGNIKFCEDIEPDYEERWYKFLIPTYDELSVFLMSIALILMTIINSEMRKQLWRFVSEEKDWRIVFWVAFIIAALCVCLYHPFTTRKKHPAEKYLMLFLAVLVNGSTGILAGNHMLEQSTGWLIIFPIWNVINGIILLTMFRYKYIDERSISDRDTNTAEVILGLVITITLLIVCNFIYKLYWAITLSICIAYTTSLNKMMRWAFSSRQRIAT